MGSASLLAVRATTLGAFDPIISDFSCPFASDRFKFPAIPFCHYIIYIHWAIDGARFRNLWLGKPTLYQLSYYRKWTPLYRGVACYNKSTACSTRPTNDSVDKYACRFTDYKTCHSVCAEPIQCFAPTLSASLGLYLILYKKLTLSLKVWWLDKYLHCLDNVHLLVCVIPKALVSFRTSLARTMCYVVIHILMWSR